MVLPQSPQSYIEPVKLTEICTLTLRVLLYHLGTIVRI